MDTRIKAMSTLHRMNVGLLERRDFEALRIGQRAFECVFHDVEGSPTRGMTQQEFQAYSSTPYHGESK